jgi:hypothetical protein
MAPLSEDHSPKRVSLSTPQLVLPKRTPALPPPLSSADPDPTLAPYTPKTPLEQIGRKKPGTPQLDIWI